MRHILTLAALALPFVLISGPSVADVDCSRQDVRLDGDLGGGPFSVPARLGAAPGPNIGFSEEDCIVDEDQLERDAQRFAGIAASMDAYGVQEGLNLTLNYANVGLNSDTNAAGGAVSYKHKLSSPGMIHEITGKIAGACDTTGDECGIAAGLTLSFGTF